jgi:hypothetical protein
MWIIILALSVQRLVIFKVDVITVVLIIMIILSRILILVEIGVLQL